MQSTPFTTITTTNYLIQKWLAQRQEMIVILHQLCSHRPFNDINHSTVLETLQEFCQLLVDYVSTGHFEIFERILHIVELSENASFPQQLMQSLQENTVATLEFNDKYQSLRDINHLEIDLSLLAERLAERLESEDRLIKIYNELNIIYPQAKRA